MPDTQENSAPHKTASLMISYSRKDKVFVKQLYDSLVARGFDPKDIWVDWEGIPLSADWMAEITKGIQSSNAFIFVISPDSIASDVCAKELEIAANSNKRFIPILYREPGRGSNLHPKISSHNWVFIRDEQELEKMLPALVDAINTDLDWLAQHTRLFNRATEWEGKGRNDSYLVRGNDLQDAETFISQGAAGKEPPPTSLHVEYVQVARKHAAATRRRNRIIATVVGIALFVLSIFALVQWGIAEQETVRANDNANTAVAEQVRADNNAATAQANEQIAIENEAIANANARAANALALASEAINQRNSDTQLSLMLALLSIQETKEDNFVLLESQSALFSSLNTPNVLHTWETDGAIVWTTAYDPTGAYIAIGDGDGLVQVFDAESLDQIFSHRFDGEISSLDFSPDGKRLGIASWDGTARVMDVETGEELFSLAGHDGYSINDIAFSSDGTMIATVGDDALVKIWQAGTGVIKVTLPSHTGEVVSVAFSPDNTRLISGSRDDTAILWDLETNSLLFKLRPDGFDTNGKFVESVAFSSDGSRVITGGYKTVVVWNASNGTELQRLNGNQATIYDVDFAPDNLSMITASSGIKVWDWVYGTERFNLSSHHGEVNSVSFNSQGDEMITGSWDYTAKLWAANLKIETLRLKQHNSPNWDADYSPDGKWLFTVGDTEIYVHDASTGDVVDAFNGYAAFFNPQNSQQIMTNDGVNAIVWTIGQDEPEMVVRMKGDDEFGRAPSAAFSSDGGQIVFYNGVQDEALKVWDIENNAEAISLDGYDDGQIFDVLSNGDGYYVLSESGNAVGIWDLNNGGNGPLYLEGHTDLVLTAAFSPDGMYVYTGSYDNTVRKWDAKTGEMLLVMTGHTGRVLGVDVSPDGSLVASASADTTVRVWDAVTGKEIYKYEGNNEDANSVAFSPDGKRVLTASEDNATKEFTIDYDSLLQVAQEYELRPLTTEECQRYLYRDDCTLTLFGGTSSADEVSSSPASQAAPTPVAEQSAQVATPTAVPTATVASTGSDAFYTEEFDGDLDAWNGFMATGTENQVNVGIDSGSLFVQLSSDAEKIPRFYLVNPASEYSSVQLELATTNYGNNANGVSLVCNYDGTNWYEFTISNAGLYSINTYDPTATALLGYVQLAGGGSGAIKSGQAANVYRAICKGNELALYINDTLVKSIVDTKYNLTSGQVGLGVSSPQTLPVEVSFESLTVSEP